MPNATPAQDKLEAFGIDALCECVMGGKTLTGIAKEIDVGLTRLLAWIEAAPERSARVREARSSTGRLWDEKAESEIRDASDEFGLKKAKELAHHYRWRASKISVKEYGDKVQQELTGANGGPVALVSTIERRIVRPTGE